MSRPLQNRVSPSGEIVAVSARGTMFGNRGGRIHSDDRQIVRQWASKQWICCVLEFKNRQRTVMGDGYTELFFLDEATALAAGHRPCFECRRADAVRFATHWAELRGRDGRAKVAEMDKVLHEERRQTGEMRDFEAVPHGAMVRDGGQLYLRFGNGACAWSFEGYDAPERLTGPVEVITPGSICDILAAGYGPQLHPSALIAP